MSVSSRVRRAARPDRAIDYWSGRRAGNEIPAILFLFLALVALVSLKNSRLPTLGEGITLGLFAGLVVAAGIMAPHLVTLFLLALLVAGILGFAGPITGILENVNRTVEGLIPNPTGAGGGQPPRTL